MNHKKELLWSLWVPQTASGLRLRVSGLATLVSERWVGFLQALDHVVL